jgi:hypothetical protein
VLRLRALGYRAFLIGETFMIATEPGAALRALLAGTGVAANGRDTERDATPRAATALKVVH